MASLVLVHGFWLGGWGWDKVVPGLRDAGHDVHPITLTGAAERAAEATPDVDVQTHIADVVGYIEKHDLRDVVLVGHSGANMPVTGAADRIPERISRLVYVDSGPMPSGMGVIDFLPPAGQEAQRKLAAEEGEGWYLPVPAFDPAADPANLAGISEHDLEMMRSRGTRQPVKTTTDALDRPDTLPVPAAAITCTFSPDQVGALAESGNPIFALLAQLDLHHLPTGHWPQFSRPDDLAAVLAAIAG